MASQLVQHPSKPLIVGARAGDLMFLGFDPAEQTAVIHKFNGRAVTKILIQPVGPLAQPATVEGWRCSDRKPLRFWYRGGTTELFPEASITEAMLATRGDLKVEITTESGPPDSLPAGHPGDFLLSSTGFWAISVQEGTRVDTFTISVLAD